MGSLKDWAKRHQLYLKLEEGQPTFCKFLRFEEFVDHDNDDREKIRYFLEVSGDEKILESQSVGLAEAMSVVKNGDWIKITKTGKGRQTHYSVEIVEEP